MALKAALKDREYDKFSTDSAGNTAIRVVNAGEDTNTTGTLVLSGTGSGALSFTSSIAAEWRLESFTILFDSAPTTSEDLTLTIDATDGSAYDAVIFSSDPSVGSKTSLYWAVGGLNFEAGDEIKLSYTNTDANTYGYRLVYKLV